MAPRLVMAYNQSFSTGDATQLLVLIILGLAAFVIKAFRVPAELRHLPRVSIVRLLISYLTVEEENHRIQRLLMPFAQRGHGVVVVWALGRWMVHILDEKVWSLFRKNEKNGILIFTTLP